MHWTDSCFHFCTSNNSRASLLDRQKVGFTSMDSLFTLLAAGNSAFILKERHTVSFEGYRWADELSFWRSSHGFLLGFIAAERKRLFKAILKILSQTSERRALCVFVLADVNPHSVRHASSRTFFLHFMLVQGAVQTLWPLILQNTAAHGAHNRLQMISASGPRGSSKTLFYSSSAWLRQEANFVVELCAIFVQKQLM